jgi:hypothetical protein
MTRRHHLTGVLVAALTALSTGSFIGSTGLVFCVGTNGHRALELEHPGMECPTLVSSQNTRGISMQPSAECLDLPAVGTGSTALSSPESDRVPTAPVTFLTASPECTPRIARRPPAATEARAGPPDLALHLRSTVLLV